VQLSSESACVIGLRTGLYDVRLYVRTHCVVPGQEHPLVCHEQPAAFVSQDAREVRPEGQHVQATGVAERASQEVANVQRPRLHGDAPRWHPVGGRHVRCSYEDY
jgi:hypothetical protein